MSNVEKVSNEDLIMGLKTSNQGDKTGGKRHHVYLLLCLIILLVVGLIVASRGTISVTNNLASETTIHWHAKLTVYKNSASVPIPAGVGLTNLSDHPETLHTHAADNIVHMEIPGPVANEKVKLARFLEVWGQDLGHMKSLKVNGVAKPELGEYVMRDHDEIEAYF